MMLPGQNFEVRRMAGNLNTKQKIFNTAVELFSQRGFKGVSIRDITRQVGIKESSLYNHYKNKDEILDVIFTYYQKEIEKMIPTESEMVELVDKHTPYEVLKEMLSKSKTHGENPLVGKIYRIICMEKFKNEQARDISLNEMSNTAVRAIERVISLMIEKRVIKHVDPKLIAKEYFHVIHSLVDKINVLSSFEMSIDQVEEDLESHLKFIYELIKL